MAKQQVKPKSKQQSTAPAAPSKPAAPAENVKVIFQLPGWALYVFIFLFSVMLYSNTLWNNYAIDDTIVLTDNKFTKKGFAGLKDHFTHDMFEGFFGERGARLVSGGRYRPLSMATLTVEYEITRKMKGDKRDVITDKDVIIGSEADPYMVPMLSHGINILLFGLTCVLLFYILQQIIPAKYSLKTPLGAFGVSFFATLLYAAHPIHTEAVANIKGRDEVMCMLFSLLALLASLRYVKTQNIVHLVWGTLIFFVALLSKENAITFFAVIPLTFFFFTKAKGKDYLFVLVAYAVPTAVFLLLRSKFTQSGITQDSPEILNNPFLLATPGQRYATTVLTFLYYFKLLVFPNVLTHDYYFNEIPYVDFSDPMVLLSILINLGLIAYAVNALIKMWKDRSQKDISAFAILFYFITFSIASNVLFTVGVLMNERFIYMSSLGFCILLAYLIIRSKDKYKIPMAGIAGIFLIILSFYSVKTFSRNYDWKDSFTLFRKDVWKSPNSAKIQTSVGGDLTKAAAWNIQKMKDSGVIMKVFSDLSGGSKSKEELQAINALPDSTIRYMLLDSSISHLIQATRIYTTHSNAWLLYGNALYQRNNHKAQEVIPIYEKALAYRVGGYYDADYNLGIVYNEINDPAKAKQHLLGAYSVKPESMEVRFLLAQVYAKLNKPDSVAYWLKRGLEVKKEEAQDYYLIGTGFGKVGGNLIMAIQYLNKAIELNPKVELYYEDLAVAYGLNKQYDQAIATGEKLVAMNPQYESGYLNIAVSYRNKGDNAKANQYQAKYNQVVVSNITRVYNQNPKNPQFAMLYAQAYARLNMHDSVYYWLKKYSELKPLTAADYFQLATTYSKDAQNLPKAIEFVSKAIEANPNDLSLYDQLAVLYNTTKQIDQAIAVCQKEIQINPSYPLAYSNLSALYRSKGNVALSEEYRQKFAQLQPQATAPHK